MDLDIFTDTQLHLKQIRLDDMNEVAKSAMAIAFAGFADDIRPSSDQIEKYLADRRVLTGVQNQGFDPTPYRRYAGESRSFPRNRYYSITSTEAGDDHGTLVREMRTYHVPRKAGIVQICDSTLSDDEPILSKWGISEPSLNLIFCPLAGKPNRFTAKFTDTPMPFLVNLPLRLESRYVKNVVDLRNPITANNFAKALSRLRWPDTSSAFPLRPELNGFDALLPCLLDQSIGGAGETNIIGIWLRKIGANGLIFPSARVDPYVKVNKNVVREAQGWSYVDYEGAPAPEVTGAIHGEKNWPDHITHTPEGPQEPYFYPLPAARIYFEREGDSAGSWYVRGLRKSREALWRFYMAWECLDAFSAGGDEDEEMQPVYRWLLEMFLRANPRHKTSEPPVFEQDPDIAAHRVEILGANSFVLQEALQGSLESRNILLEFADSLRADSPKLGSALELLMKRSENYAGEQGYLSDGRVLSVHELLTGDL